MEGSGQSSKARSGLKGRVPVQIGKNGQPIIGFAVYEEIGIEIVNPSAIPDLCPSGCIRVWDDEVLAEGLVFEEAVRGGN